jgi:hypothetical protein
LRKLLPFSLDVGWVCTLALNKILKNKSFLDSLHVIFSLNFDHSSDTLHRLAMSESFPALSFHAGPKSGITYFFKTQDLHVGSFLCDLVERKNSKLKYGNFSESPFTE